MVWFRYDFFRDDYPGTLMDRAQWSYWTAGKTWAAAGKVWAAAGNRLMPAKPADNKAIKSGRRTEDS